ncbi:MAG: bifunctional adenosylcobinamide kinase/adenosylcobinamide-phosphate guanylyltransferase [bacterium]
MKKIFITGGARSGKSKYALEMAKEIGGEVTFVATCIPDDSEMRERIEEHKKMRPKEWHTIEESLNLPKAIAKISTPVIIVDCLTLWIANLMEAKMDVVEASKDLFCALKKVRKTAIVVSNEVGSGIVPDNRLAREFRDMAGVVNQQMAQIADEVYLMVAGIPVKIKGGKNAEEDFREDQTD